MAPQARESTLYDLLEVGANATMEEIEASYHRISSYLAPDSLAAYSLMDEEELTQRRALLDEAYRTLSDPARRAAYDRTREGGGYPQVLVPAAPSDATMSVGVVHTGEDVPPLDVDAIFRGGGETPPAVATTTRIVEAGEVALAPSIDDDEVEASPAYEGRPSATGPLTREAPRSAEGHVAGKRSPAPRGPAVAGAPPPAARPISRPPPPIVVPATPPPPGAFVHPSPAEAAHAVASRAASPAEVSAAAARAAAATQDGQPPRPPPVARKAPPPTTAAPKRLVPSSTIELTPDTEFSGALLRHLRESCNASVDDIARITKVRKHYLEAIEEHAFDQLPAPVYVRGFVAEYARVLGLDVQRVAQSYMTLYRRYRGEGA